MDDLAGLKILVVEDEPLIAMQLEDVLTDFGCTVVGSAPTLEKGMQLVREETFDGAILDVTLGREKVFPLADVLAEQSIPFVYVTGYGQSCLRDCDRGRAVLQKPYSMKNLVEIMGRWRRA